MRTKIIFLSVIIVVVMIIVYSCKENQPAELTSVRIGWQIPLATQGQIVQVLKKTDLLEKRGINPNFVSFSYGGPQSEAALAGELDVIFVGDQPAVNLISKGGQWKIVSRLFYTRTAVMVPMNSDIKSMSDFKNKSLASPFGSVAHREAILKEQSVGMDADKDVNNLNLDILEISSVVQAGGDKTWGKLDGVAVWEPSTSLFEMNNLARVVDKTITLGVVAISDEFLQKYPDATTQFLAALLEAWAYYSSNQAKVNRWYIEDARLDYDPQVLISASSIEPNINAKSIKEIDLSLSDEHIKTLETAAKWSYERGFTKVLANMPKAVNRTFFKEATRLVND